MSCSSRCRASITDLQRATRALWERPCVAIGAHSGPGISALMRRLSGALCGPFATQGPPVGAGLPANTVVAATVNGGRRLASRPGPFAGKPAPTDDRWRLDYQRPAASWSLCFPSTHPVVCQSALPVRMTRIICRRSKRCRGARSSARCRRMNCSSRCRASITDPQRATRALWERPCVAIGPRSGPGISALMRRLSGALCGPFATQGPPCRSGFTREYGSGGNGERRVEIGQQGRPFRG